MEGPKKNHKMTNSSNGEHHRGPERAKPEAARITVPSNPPTGRCKDQPDKEENDRIGEIEKTLSRKDLDVLKEPPPHAPGSMRTKQKPNQNTQTE